MFGYARHIRFLAAKRLGMRCANKECRYCNYEDNSLGCAKFDLLHIDHIQGNGAEERSRLSNHGVYRRILEMEHPETEYQLLCANCNWQKKIENNEYRYKKPSKSGEKCTKQ